MFTVLSSVFYCIRDHPFLIYQMRVLKNPHSTNYSHISASYGSPLTPKCLEGNESIPGNQVPCLYIVVAGFAQLADQLVFGW